MRDTGYSIVLFSLRNSFILAACIGVSIAAPSLFSQEIIIPAPAKIPAEPGVPAHLVNQSRVEPWTARDPVTGHYLRWDCARGTWFDLDTQRPVGYDAYRDENGNIIPAPPYIDGPGGSYQPVQGTTHHDQAFDPQTRQQLQWDANAQTWKRPDGAALGFNGYAVSTCPPFKANNLTATFDPKGNGDWTFSAPYSMYVSAQAEHRIYPHWEHVPLMDPLVKSNDATSQSNGVGLWMGYRPIQLPFYLEAGGYWAGGLKTDLMLNDGRRAESDVDDFGAGIGIRYERPFKPGPKFWAHVDAMFEHNASKYREFNSANALIFSENRNHSAWTGNYGVGLAYPLTPRIDINIGAGYEGMFKSGNADENFRLSTGLVLRLGSR